MYENAVEKCQTTSSIRDPKPGKYNYFVNPTKCSRSPVHQIKLSNEAELRRFLKILSSDLGQITTKKINSDLIFRYMIMHGEKIAVSNEIFSGC